MNDNLNYSYISSTQRRNDRERASFIAEERKRLDEERAAKLAAKQRQQEQLRQQPHLPPTPQQDSPGVIGEVLKGVAGGVTDAARNVWNTIDEAATWLDNNFLDLRIGSDTFGTFGGSGFYPEKEKHKTELQIDPIFSENKTGYGQAIRSVTQFVTPFLGCVKALKYAGMAGSAARGMAAGAATDFAAFDPHEKRLSNLILEMTDENSALRNPVFEYLAADPNDTALEGRFKNALEGMFIGGAMEGVFLGFKAARSWWRARGKNPAEAVQQAGEAARREAAEGGVRQDLADQVTDVAELNRREPNKWETRSTASTGSEFQTPPVQEQWRIAETDPTPRKALFDPKENTIQLSKETRPGQIDLDTAIPAAMRKTERTAAEESMLRGYKELQEAVIEKLPDQAKAATKGADDLQARIAAAQKKVDDLLEAGKDTEKAQKVLDSLLRKADEGLYDSAAKLSSKEANQLATSGDKLVDEIAANNEKILTAYGKKQSGEISTTMLAHLVASSLGGITGYLSAEDDATFAERIGMAITGAFAGMGIKVGAVKVFNKAARHAAKNASPDVKSLAREEVANIAPRTPRAKRVPVIDEKKVEKLVEAVKTGSFEDLAKAVKESDFNFTHIDTREDVRATIDAFSAVFEKETTLAKGGKQTFEMMQELAEEIGTNVKTLQKLYHGTSNLGAKILANRMLMASSADRVTQLAKLAMTGDAEAILSVRKQVALHAAFQAEMKGVQTEVARALAQFRIKATSIDMKNIEVSQLIDAMGGHTANKKFAEQLAAISDPKKLGAVIRKSALARTGDALYEAWINGLLSSPATHAVNAIGNALVAIGSVAERGTAAMIGKALRTGPEAITMGETKAHLFGLVEGFKDAVAITGHGLEAMKKAGGEALHGNFSAAKETIASNSKEFGSGWKALATGESTLDAAALGSRESSMLQASITADKLGLDHTSLMGKAVDGLGAIYRTPSRALAASDEIFKTMSYRGELKAQAYRQATSEGLSGNDLFKRVAELIEDPPKDLSDLAFKSAREMTFTIPLGVTGQKVQEFARYCYGGRWVMPFIRVPTNIIKYVGVRTPGLNLIAESVRADFMAGGARRDLMLAKTALGGAMYMLAGYAAAQGHITGGGEKNQSAERLAGWQPYSVKIGDTYYSFNRTDPIGFFLGIAADITDIAGHADEKTVGDLTAAAVLAINRNLTSKSYVEGLVNTINALSNWEAESGKYFRNLASSFVPSAVNQVRKEVDPNVREVWDVVDAMKNRIPGFSKDLPPALNIFGEEILQKGGLGPDIASPIMTSQESTDPAAQEIARLNVDLKRPSRTIGGAKGAPGVDLTPKQYHRLMQIMGAEVNGGGFKEGMLRLLRSPSYLNLPEDPSNTIYPEGKEKRIQALYDRCKQAAIAQLLKEDKSLKDKVIQNRRNAANSILGLPIIPFQ